MNKVMVSFLTGHNLITQNSETDFTTRSAKADGQSRVTGDIISF